MKYTNRFKGCRVVIRDATNDQLIADTKIVDFDSYRNVVKISASSVNCLGERAIYALIIDKKGMICEYAGQMNNAVIANEVEVRLGAGRSKEDRKKARYNIEANGKVEAVILEEQAIYLHKPIEMSTKNISANGLLLETMSGSFDIGSQIVINFKLGDSILKNKYEVVRIQNSNLKTEEYGCVLVQTK